MRGLLVRIAVVIVAGIAVTAPASAPAQDDRMADLEATVAALDERVTALEQSAPAPFVEIAGDTITITGDVGGALDPINLPSGMYYFQLTCERGGSSLFGDYVNGDYFGLIALDGEREFESVEDTIVLDVSCHERTPWTVTIQAP